MMNLSNTFAIALVALFFLGMFSVVNSTNALALVCSATTYQAQYYCGSGTTDSEDCKNQCRNEGNVVLGDWCYKSTTVSNTCPSDSPTCEYSSTCSESGTNVQTFYTCSGSTCVRNTFSEVGGCTRSTTGISCTEGGVSGTCSGGTCVPTPTCTPNWSCTGWSTCTGSYSDACSNTGTGTQTKTCSDLNGCGGSPYTESQSCQLTRNTDGISCTTSSGTSGTCSAGKCEPVRDTTPPTGSVLINDDDASTSSPSVTLTLSCSDSSGCSHMKIANKLFDPNGIPSATVEPYTTSKAWTLLSEAGTKAVYVVYKDGAGNWMPDNSPASDTIELKTCGGSLQLTLDPDETEANKPVVFTASGLSACNGKTIKFIETERYSGTTPLPEVEVGSCPSGDTGCETTVTSPKARLTPYKYYAKITLDNNNDLFSPTASLLVGTCTPSPPSTTLELQNKCTVTVNVKGHDLKDTADLSVANGKYRDKTASTTFVSAKYDDTKNGVGDCKSDMSLSQDLQQPSASKLSVRTLAEKKGDAQNKLAFGYDLSTGNNCKILDVTKCFQQAGILQCPTAGGTASSAWFDDSFSGGLVIYDYTVGECLTTKQCEDSKGTGWTCGGDNMCRPPVVECTVDDDCVKLFGTGYTCNTATNKCVEPTTTVAGGCSFNKDLPAGQCCTVDTGLPETLRQSPGRPANRGDKIGNYICTTVS